MKILKKGNKVLPKLPYLMWGDCKTCQCQVEVEFHPDNPEIEFDCYTHIHYVFCPTENCGCQIPLHSIDE
jgi:hypothetical protein